MKIIVSKRLLSVLSFNFASAMALYPFVLLRDKEMLNDKTTLLHEKIHLRQQIELLIIPFYLIYVLEYLYGRCRGLSHYNAYRQISFECEAYDNEKNRNYLKEKRWASFIRYMKNKKN